MCIKKSSILFIFILAAFLGKGQESSIASLDSLAGRIIKELRYSSSEIFHVVTNKELYFVGESVLFKIFVQDELSGRLAAKSNILFVDIVDDQDHLVNQCMLHLSDFKTDGSFLLPDTLSSGHYWVRAYTQRSVLQHPKIIGIRSIYLVNSVRPDSNKRNRQEIEGSQKKAYNDSLSVRLYPEGGTVIGGANTMLAIRVSNTDGIPYIGKGYVRDSHDSIVAKFSTNSFGLGKFDFYCHTWSQYKIHLIRDGKSDHIIPVPKVNLFAAQLSMIENKGIKKLRIVLEDSLYRRDKVTYLLGISGDSLCFSAVGKGSFEVIFPEYRFPKGVASLLLFDEHQKLLSQRNIYIEGNEPTIKIESDKQTYAAREKVTLSFELIGADNKPTPASFTVMVIDQLKEGSFQQLIPIQLQHNSASSEHKLWITDDSLFQKLSSVEKDLFMLTDSGIVGKFNSNQLSATVIPNTLSEDSSLYIKGKVLDGRNRPMAKKIVTLFGDMKTKLFVSDTTDNEGRFLFPFTAYDDQTRFNLQVTDFSSILLPSKIILDTLLKIPTVSTPSGIKQYYVLDELESIRKKMLVQIANDTVIQRRGKEWLADVNVKGYIKKDPGYDVKKRMSLFSKVIPAELLMRSGNGSLGNAIFRVPGIHLRNGFVTVTGGNSFGTGAQTEPLLVVDGVPLPFDTLDKVSGSEPSPLLMALNRIDPSIVDFIEVLTGSESAMYGTRGGNGVIIVNTRSTLLFDDPTKNNGMRNFLVKGFQVPERFAEPDYSLKENRISKIPDNRTFLFWYGDGVTDSNGKAKINFYTADPITTYTVTVSGVTSNGLPFRKMIQIYRK